MIGMSFAKVLGAFALAGLGGLGLLVFDYVTQRYTAEKRFGGQQYVETLIYRFGDSGGVVGLLLRSSLITAAARPPAPTGWMAEDWSADHDILLFSAAQSQALDHELTRATLGLPDIRQMGRIDIAARDAYRGDTSITYRNGRGVIALRIHDPARSIAHPVWAAHERAIEAHFARIDTLITYDTVQGITWFEAHGPVELADNGPRPDRLRSFEGRMGDMTLYLTTRTPEPQIARFLETVDLGALRALAQDRPTAWDPSGRPLPEIARASQVPAAAPTTIRVNRGPD